jgi:hypothetical protein
MANIYTCGICSHSYLKDDDNVKDSISLWVNRYSNAHIIICRFCKDKMREHLVDDNHKDLKHQMMGLQRIQEANQTGLQNVYNTFSKLTDGGFIRDWNVEKEKLQKDMADMKKSLEDIAVFVKGCHKKMEVINQLYSLRNSNPDTVNKLYKLMKAMEDE